MSRGSAGVCGESWADAGAPPAWVLLGLEKGRLGGEPGTPRPATDSRLHIQHLIPILKCLQRSAHISQKKILKIQTVETEPEKEVSRG